MGTYFDRASVIAGIGGVALLLSTIGLPWFESTVDGEVVAGGATNALDSFSLIHFVLIAAAIGAIGAFLLGLTRVSPTARADACKLAAGLAIGALLLIVYRIAFVPEPHGVGDGAEIDVARKLGLAAALLAAATIAVSDVFGKRLARVATPEPTVASVAPAPPAVVETAALVPPPATPKPKPAVTKPAKRKPAKPKAATPATAKPKPAKPKPATPRPASSKAAKPKAIPPEPSASAVPGAGSLTAATFEDLRGFGLSITQAKRIISYRDERGVLASVADLDGVPGLPQDVLAELKQKLGG